MSNPIKTGATLFFLLLLFQQSHAQSVTPEEDTRATTISSIPPIRKAQNHYLELQALNSEVNEQYAWMDTITFSPDQYKNYSILFALMDPSYLTKGQAKFLATAVECPANSSEQTRAELDFLVALQESRTEEEEKRVLDLASIGYWPDVNYLPTHPRYQENLKHLFFECREIMGPDCTSEKYPATSKLLQGIMNDMRLMEFTVKYRIRRARPYELEPKLQPLQIMGSPSFASGHTLWAYIQAYTLGALFPDKRDAFVDLAYDIGFSREILGVHYPSDEEASRQLAHRMITLMWQTEKFQQDFTSAKAEWR